MSKDLIDKITDKLETISISTDRLKSYNDYLYSSIEDIDNKEIMDKLYALNYAINTSIKDIKTDTKNAYDTSLKLRDKIKE